MFIIKTISSRYINDTVMHQESEKVSDRNTSFASAVDTVKSDKAHENYNNLKLCYDNEVNLSGC